MAVTATNLGVITAYGDAVAAGYTGTKAEWQTLMASYATVGQQAVDAKNDAVAAKNTAVAKATEATTAASTATTKANEASASAQSIAQSASQIAQNTSDISELKEDLQQMQDFADILQKTSLFEQGGVLPDGTEFDATTRVRTGYIDIDEYGQYINSDPTNFGYWIRVFDSSKSILGSVYVSDTNITIATASSTKSLILKMVRTAYSTAKYIRIIGKRNNEQDLSPNDPESTLIKDGYIKIMSASFTAEHGSLKTADGNLGDSWVDIYNRNDYVRVSRFIKTIPSTLFSLLTLGNGFRIIEYDKDFAFLKCTTATSMIQLSDATEFVKINVYKQNATYTSIEVMYATNGNFETVANARTSTAQESFIFEVGNSGEYTVGMLKLPSNYSAYGKGVPLIVFIHGSGDMVNKYVQTMTTDYTDYYNYLRDNGYALFDCYGWDTSYENNGSNTFASPNNLQCFNSGIEYVLDRWNLDRGNIFIASKSLGGITAASLSLNNKYNIKAAGLLAPALDMLELYPFAYQQSTRVCIATDMGFIGDWESVLDVPNEDFVRDTAFNNIMELNADNMCGYMPMWESVTLSISDKISNSLNHVFNDSAYQFCKTPIKIWCAQDDQAVYYAQSVAFVKRIKNGGGVAEMRTMPSGTGGHHSVDSDPSAPQTTNVTTKLGIVYASVPTAYYELCEWFNKHLN